jgi:hypothetical protein
MDSSQNVHRKRREELRTKAFLSRARLENCFVISRKLISTSSFVATPLVKVLLGPPDDRQDLLIHKGIITARSDFFHNALSGQWNNSEDNVVDLYKFDPNLSPEDFQRYLGVLCTNYAEKLANTEGWHQVEVVRLYVIAEAMLDRQSRNVLVRAL